MKFLACLLLTALSVVGCDFATAQDDHRFAELPKTRPNEAVATFASGCYWTTEHIFESLKGVRTVVSGHTGGTTPNPSYEAVAGGSTGHAEAVQVYYDPKVVSYATLLKVFFIEHDPTTLNRQGPDRGDEYRSAIFYRTPDEKAQAEAEMKRVTAAHRYADPIVTQVVPFTVFYPAERYHQDYAVQHPSQPYIATVSHARFEKFRQECAALVKPGAE